MHVYAAEAEGGGFYCVAVELLSLTECFHRVTAGWMVISNTALACRLTRNSDLSADIVVAVVQLRFGEVEHRDQVALPRVQHHHVS